MNRERLTRMEDEQGEADPGSPGSQLFVEAPGMLLCVLPGHCGARGILSPQRCITRSMTTRGHSTPLDTEKAGRQKL